jgi:uncharacterized protein with GYD domain
MSREILNFFRSILTPFVFKSIVASTPGTSAPKEIPMPYFCHQVSYTKEAWAKLMENPQDRLEAVRTPIEKLGGKLQISFFAFGAFDVLAITEMPDNIAAAALSMAFAGGGAVQNIQTTPLMTAAQAVEALRRAGTCGYRSITETSAAAAAP